MFQKADDLSHQRLGFRESQVTKFLAYTDHTVALYRKLLRSEADGVDLADCSRKFVIGDIQDDQILMAGIGEPTTAVCICNVGQCRHLAVADPAIGHGDAYVVEARLFLREDTEVVMIPYRRSRISSVSRGEDPKSSNDEGLEELE